MSRTFSFIVDAGGQRLDKYLDEHCPDFSRSRLQRLISDGDVTVDERVAKSSLRVSVGQRIVVTVPDPIESHLEPQDIPLEVVHQNDDLLIINKPAGLTVHPAPGHPDGTLVNAVLALCPDLPGIGGTIRPGIVHRLDKDTSGLIVVAKNEIAHNKLATQLKNREFEKKYLALVQGKVMPSKAVIEASIGRDPSNRKRMALVSNGRHATTRYQVLDYYKGRTLVEAKLETGRTHQIRVHFASIGHPIVGDETYGRPGPALGRQFLHAHLLGFRLPSTDEYVEFKSDLPAELQEYLASVGPSIS